MRSNYPLAGANNSTLATQAADNSLSANTSTTNEAVVDLSANNSDGYNRPVRSSAPPIRYGYVPCHQELGLRHFGAEGRNIQHTAMTDQVKGQSQMKESTQRRLLAEVIEVISQLTTALCTSSQATQNTSSQATLDNKSGSLH